MYSQRWQRAAQGLAFSKSLQTGGGGGVGGEMEVLPSDVINGPGVEARQGADTFPAGVRAAACHPCTTDFS